MDCLVLRRSVPQLVSKCCSEWRIVGCGVYCFHIRTTHATTVQIGSRFKGFNPLPWSVGIVETLKTLTAPLLQPQEPSHRHYHILTIAKTHRTCKPKITSKEFEIPLNTGSVATALFYPRGSFSQTTSQVLMKFVTIIRQH